MVSLETLRQIKPVALAVPGFILLILVEMLLARKKVSYEIKDTAASLTMGLGNIVVKIATGLITLAITKWIYNTYHIFEIQPTLTAFVALLFLEDFCFYWRHRFSHELRWLWAAHVVHHSSQHFNLSTALRQTWTDFLGGGWVAWLPLALIGFPPEMIVLQRGISLIYQFLTHTESVGKLGPLEWVMNTPSHHRVHHAKNLRYLDKNHAGIFIIWDRMFGTFAEEDPNEPCEYGVIKGLGTFNPLKIAFHEWADILRDATKAPTLKDKLMYMFGPPGWSHDGSKKTVKEMRAEQASKGLASPTTSHETLTSSTPSPQS